MALYIFDKDGTLVQFVRKKGIPVAASTPEEQVLVLGAFEMLARLRAEGHALAIASNQSKVAEGQITLDESRELVENCAAKVGGVNACRLSPFDPKAPKELDGKPNPYARDDPGHKPHPGMILDLMQELGYAAQDTIMIGDKDQDRKAAEAAGVRFVRAHAFFKLKKGRLVLAPTRSRAPAQKRAAARRKPA